MARIIKQNAIRKVDSLGRVVIPKGLRDQYELVEGQELDTYMIYDDGIEYIAFKVKEGKEIDPKYAAAAKVLSELGLNIPDSLKDILE